MSAANYTTIENAIYAWALAKSGLASTQILWSSQTEDTQKPSGQHITLKLDTGQALGAFPETVHTYDDEEATNGQEITHATREVIEASLSVQVIGGPTVGAGSSRSLANTLQRSLALDGVRAAFQAAGFSVIDRGTLSHIPEILDADFEARTVFDVRLLVSDSATEQTGFFETVQITDELTDETFEVSI
jgi:hypothetical protein